MCQRFGERNELPNDPIDFDDILEDYTKAFERPAFLFENVNTGEGRIMIFSTVTNIRRMANSTILLLDGTFKIAPVGFSQVFTIHGSVGEGTQRKFLPFVHILLPNKSEKTYKRALKLLRNEANDHGINLKPQIILTDFEAAEINAAKRVFREAEQFGYFFHFTKNLWKKVQKFGLAGAFRKELRVKLVSVSCKPWPS